MLLKHFNYISQSSFSKATKREGSIPEISGIKLIPFPQHLRVKTLPLCSNESIWLFPGSGLARFGCCEGTGEFCQPGHPPRGGMVWAVCPGVLRTSFPCAVLWEL